MRKVLQINEAILILRTLLRFSFAKEFRSISANKV